MRHLIGIPFQIKAFAQMGVVIITAIYGGRMVSKHVFRDGKPAKDGVYNDYPLKFTKGWYVWSLFGAALMAAFAGPLAVTVFIEPIYNDTATSETVRLLIATFGLSLIHI